MNPTVQISKSGKEDVITLTTKNAKANVWPSRGFNCVNWMIKKPDGDWGHILYSASDWVENPVPTRSGNPILFPFPNRLANGRFDSLGQTYQLPLTEATKTHAIHGFAPREPWTIVGSGTLDTTAFVTARLRLTALPWPGELAISLTSTLSDQTLSLDAVIENYGSASAPYGLGYHAYFRHPLAPTGELIDRLHFRCQADRLWVCDNNIPTGELVPTPAELNFASPRPLNQTQFDTLLTNVKPGPIGRILATLMHPDHSGTVAISADDSFSHLVLFTPSHRQAIAIEPYTCATNAANLPNSVPHGWQFLMPGMKKHHHVKYCWQI
jgi:aldose 1-epimerase